MHIYPSAFAGLPQLMPNADQCQPILINGNQNPGIDPKYLSVWINIEKCLDELIGIGINSIILIELISIGH